MAVLRERRSLDSDEASAWALSEIERLRAALRYWLPDETMIPDGHEIAWNEHVALIPEHRRQPEPTMIERDALPGGWAHPGKKNCLGRAKDGGDCVLPIQHEGDCSSVSRG